MQGAGVTESWSTGREVKFRTLLGGTQERDGVPQVAMMQGGILSCFVWQDLNGV